MNRIANSGALPEDIIGFTRAGEELNITRQTIDSLPSVAIGIA